jgi:hypothetical protein
MRHFMLNLCAFGLALAGCGDSTNTSISDAGTTTDPGPGPVSSSDSSDAMPITTGNNDPVTTGSVSDSDGASTTLLPGTETGTSDTGEVTTTGLTTTGLTTTTGDTDDTSTGAIDSTGSESTGSESTGEVVIMDCETFKNEFNAEVIKIRSCTMDDECGVEMKGTSCGCTRNWVARKDADLTDFNELVELAGELECELPFFSTCDCPAADGFECSNSGICTWNYL